MAGRVSNLCFYVTMKHYFIIWSAKWDDNIILTCEFGSLLAFKFLFFGGNGWNREKPRKKPRHLLWFLFKSCA